MEEAELEKRKAAEAASADKTDALTGINVASMFLILSTDN